MATNSPPPMIRRMLFGGAPKMHMSAPRVSMPKVNSGILSRGMTAGGTVGGGGGSRSLGTGAGAGADNLNGFNDPVVSGMGYEQNAPQHGILGLLNNGKQSAVGDQQQALHGRFQQMSQIYNQVLDQGGTAAQAMTAVHRADPSFLMDVLVGHPAALKAFQTASDLHDFMAGKPAPGSYAPDIKNGIQYQVDPNTHEIVGSKPIPGAPQQNGTPIGKPITDASGRLVQPMMGPDGKPFVQPFTNGPAGQGGAGGGTMPAGGQGSAAGGGAVMMPQGGKMLAAEKAEIQGLEQVMGAADQAKEAAQAQGAFGIGGVTREISRILPGQSGTAAGNLDRALDTLRATTAGALTGSTRLKAQFAAMQNLVPGTMSSSGALLKGVTNLQNMGRTEIARFAQLYPNDPGVQQLAGQYNAAPSYWLGGTDQNGQHVPGMRDKLNMLTTNPQQLTSNDLQNIYAFEAYNLGPNGATPTLSDNQLASLGAQMNQRSLWGVRDALVKQNPGMSMLPDSQTFMHDHGPAVQQWGQQHPNQLRIPTLPSTPNPQATQQPPPAASYNPDVRAAQAQERADAQGRQIQQQQEQDEDSGEPEGPVGPLGAAGPKSQQPGTAPQTANYKPTSQADALNYNELQDLRRQAGKPYTPPVQWAEPSRGGSAAMPGHPNQAAARADELRRAMMQKPTPPGQEAAPQAAQAQQASQGGGIGGGMAWSQDPLAAFSGLFGKSQPAPRGEGMIPPKTGAEDQSVSGLGGQTNNGSSTAQDQNNGVSGLGAGTGSQEGQVIPLVPKPRGNVSIEDMQISPVTQKQVIPIPPPQPGNALGAFDTLDQY